MEHETDNKLMILQKKIDKLTDVVHVTEINLLRELHFLKRRMELVERVVKENHTSKNYYG